MEQLLELLVVLARLRLAGGGWLVGDTGEEGVEEEVLVEKLLEQQVVVEEDVMEKVMEHQVVVEKMAMTSRVEGSDSNSVLPKYVEAYADDMKKVQEIVKGQQTRALASKSDESEEQLVSLASLQLGPAPAGAGQVEGPAAELGWLQESDGTLHPMCEGWLVGRAPHCHLRLAGTEVSRQHASIHLGMGGRPCIKPLSGTNKVRVNGREIRELTELQDGDMVQVGRQVLVWLRDVGHWDRGGREGGREAFTTCLAWQEESGIVQG